MAQDLAGLTAVMLQRFTHDYVVKLGWRKFPFLGMIRKDTSGGGLGDKYAVRVAGNQAASTSFAEAQSQAASKKTNYKAFEIVPVDSYGVVHVKGKAIAAAKAKGLSLVKPVSSEIEDILDTVKTDAERKMFRDGSGIIGQGDGAYTVAGTTLTLADKSQARLFKIGMTVGATSAASANPRVGSAVITGVDVDAGTLETGSNWSTQITSLNNSDYLFRYKDFLAANDKLNIKGLEGWCPATAPTSGDSFHSVDRSVAPQLLAGTRYDGSGDSIEEALTNAQSAGAAVASANPRICFLAPENMRDLINSLGSKKEYTDLPIMGEKGPIANIGFRALRIVGDQSDIGVMAHPYCQIHTGWMFDPDLITLSSYGAYPALITRDGNDVLRIAADDGIEARVGGFPEVIAQPDAIVRIKLA